MAVMRAGLNLGMMGMDLTQIARSIGFGVMSSDEVHKRLLDLEKRQVVRCEMDNPDTIMPLWTLR